MLEVGLRKDRAWEGGWGQLRHVGNVGQGWTIHFAPIHPLLVRRLTLVFFSSSSFLLNLIITLWSEGKLGKTSVEKKRFFRALPEWGGGVYPCPDFWPPFFYQLVVLKMAIFHSNFTVIVCFLVIFVRIIIKITIIIIKIIIATFIISIKFFSRSYAQNVVLT